MLFEKLLQSSRVRATGGRDIRAVSCEGTLDLKLSVMPDVETPHGTTTPEQLFAACFASSFLRTMKLIAAQEDIDLPPDVAMEASVGIGSICGELGLEVELRICLPGVPRAETDLLLEQSRRLCPYSNAIQGNVPVRLVVA